MSRTEQKTVGLASDPSTGPQYRPDIDGLRAIAVTIVVGYHAFPEWVRGGFVGVDIFFVISGYLITGIISKHIETRDFSIVDFYQRRIRRIFPALLLVTYASLIAGWFLLSPGDYESLGTNIAGGAIFIQNFVLLNQVGYFDLAAAKKPLLHLWSLAVEEQYYIVWPLLLILFNQKKWNAINLTIILSIVSFALGIVFYQRNHELAFYLPVTRAWELLIGSALALGATAKGNSFVTRWITVLRDWMREKPGREKRVQDLCASIAILAILFAIIRFKPYAPVPGSATLFPTIAASLLILSPYAAINRRFLASHPMIFIGKISYPLYLWHFFLMAFARVRAEGAVSPEYMSAIVALSFILAWLTYRFVERPFRFGRGLKREGVTVLVAGMATIGILGLVVTVLHGFPNRVPKDLRPFMITEATTSSHWRVGRCMLLPEQGADSFSGCDSQGSRPIVFLWGDSFSAALYPGLDHFATSDGYSISQYDASACPPFLGYESALRPYCKLINDYVLKQIEKQRPDILVLHSKWQQYDLNGDLEKGFDETLPKLKALNIKSIVVIGPMPLWSSNGLPGNVLDYYYQTGTLLPERTKFRSLDTSTRALEARLKARAEKLGIHFISARDVMCDNDGCLARIGANGSDLTAFDIGHLTIAGSIFFAEAIRNKLLETVKTPYTPAQK